jgi:hypothetical protein
MKHVSPDECDPPRGVSFDSFIQVGQRQEEIAA